MRVGRSVRRLFTTAALLVAEVIPPVYAQQRQAIALPGLGRVRLSISQPPGDFPTLTARNAHGTVLLRERLGTADPDLFRDDSNSGKLDFVSSRVLVIENPQSNRTTILPVTRYVGGSDCAYVADPVSLFAGRLQPWFAEQPGFPAEGGVYVGPLGHGWGFGLAVWKFLWVDVYRYEASTGQATKAAHLETRGKYTRPEQALSELGLSYRDALRAARNFTC